MEGTAMRYLSLIVKNCLRNRRRAFLTISSLAISLCLLGFLVALYYALFIGGPSPAQSRRLITRHKVSITFVMPYFYHEKIAKVGGVLAVLPWQWYQGTYKDNRDQRNFFPRLATEPDRLFQVYTDYRIPEDQKKAFLADRASCIVGGATARRHGFQVGDRIQVRGDIFPVNLDLVVKGIYESPEGDDENLWFHYEYLRQSMPGRVGDSAGTFTMLVDDPANVPRIAREIDELFRNATVPTRTESEYAFGLSFLSFLGNIKVILMTICGAVTFTILLIAANTMAMSVRERVREVGVLKTLGFTQGGILWLILGEAAATSLIGGTVGLLLAQGLCIVARNAPPIVTQTKTLTLQPPVLLFLVLLSAGIGVLSAAIPAIQASRTPILDALRFTD
jgi:putative ABC transport system permease protein